MPSVIILVVVFTFLAGELTGKEMEVEIDTHFPFLDNFNTNYYLV